jgi:MFS transporter, PPP family, 3-phenylpropionic acid transporter
MTAAAVRAGRAGEPPRIDVRLGWLFGTYFATAGVLVPYLPLYLKDRGLTAWQIGGVLAMAQAMRLAGPNLWGWLADRSSHRLAILRWTAIAASVSFAGIFLPGGFALVFAVLLLTNLFMTAQMPLGEAITAGYLRTDAAAPHAARLYGRLRACGSIGFIALVLATGPLLDWLGIGWQPVLAVALLAISAGAAWRVREYVVPELPHARVSVRRRLAEPRVRWFFASVALMVCAHGALYTYYSLYLERLGYSKSAIGVFWVIGVLVEVLFFFTQGRFFRRFGAFALMNAAFVIAALRFGLIAEFAHMWLLLVIAQLMHAATFAVHHSAAIMTVQQWFPGAAAARGQALYVSIGYGLGGTAGSLLAAWLWSAVSPAAAFWSSSAAALLGWWAVQRARALDARAPQPALA